MRKVSSFNYPSRADVIASNGYKAAHVNPRHRENGITSVDLSGTIYQILCYWNSGGNLIISKRVLDASWTAYTYDGTGGLPTITVTADNHNFCAVAFDPNGYIHVSYDMHNDALNYRVSDAAIDTWTGGLGAETSMVGTNETSVTYPTFVNDPSGNLYFLFRDGISGNGDLFFYSYNHSTTTWAAATGTDTGGKLIDGKTNSTNPYWGRPYFDSDFGSGGYMHLAWKWRVDANDNADISYVKWDGTNWKQADGTSQTVPITQANCDLADDTSANLGMTYFPSIIADSSGNPHIAYAKTHTDSLRHIFHAYHNGTSWSVSQVTTTNNPNQGDNTLYYVDLCPTMAVNGNTIYMLYVDPSDSCGLLLMKTSDYSAWTHRNLYPYNVGNWQPKFDVVEWDRSSVFYFLIEEYHGLLNSNGSGSFPIYLWKVDPSTW